MRSELDGVNLITFITGSEPLALTIDYVSNKLYWSDNDGNSIRESTLDGSTQRILFSDEFFSPFFINIVRDYVVVTSQANTSYALIRLDDSSVAFVGIPEHQLYHGVSVVSLLKKPSIGK